MRLGGGPRATPAPPARPEPFWASPAEPVRNLLNAKTGSAAQHGALKTEEAKAKALALVALPELRTTLPRVQYRINGG